MTADPRGRNAPDGANPRVCSRTEDARVAVGQILPFCPPPSWYVSYWYERADAPRSARLGRLAKGLAQGAIAAPRTLRTRRHVTGAPRLWPFLSAGKE
jgi:hypothetical protein